MSERVRESVIASLLASKRFVVSVCAALAMILGAMSAGASVFTGGPTAAEPQQGGVSVFNEAPRSANISAASKETPIFTTRTTLASQNIVVQPPLYTTADTTPTKEKKGLNLKLNQDVVKATSAALFYNPAPRPEKTELTPATSQPESPAQVEPQEPTTIEPAADPTSESTAPPDQTPPLDPTTEPGMNSMATPPPDPSLTQ